MPDRAAIITGASRGIGYAIAEELGALGYQLTITARKPDGLERAAAELTEKGYQVRHVAANLADEEGIKTVVAAHREVYGRLDVLVNNGGVGIGAPAGEHQTKYIDMQLDVNLRALVMFYRETLELLQTAAAEHGTAHVFNLASIAGKYPQAWLSVYSATKAAVLAYTTSMNRELGKQGIRSTALCPGFVDTDMADFMKGSIPAEQMLQPSDLAAAVKFVTELSSAAVVPEIVFERAGETM